MKVKLRKILDERNISVYALAKQTNICQNNLGKLVKGQTTSIKFENLEALCIALKVTPNDILDIEIPTTELEVIL